MKKKTGSIRSNSGRGADLAFQGAAGFLMILFAILCTYPFWYVLIYSVSDQTRAMREGLFLLPKGFTLEYYKMVFSFRSIGNAIFISGSRAVLGTFLSVFFSAMFAYVLTKDAFRARKFVYRMMVLTMYVGAGLIPWYITMRMYGLKNSFLLYILPGIIAPYHVILIKTFIEQLPASVEESARIDGANYMQVYLRFVIPLSMPVLAAVSVFSAVGQWNAWTDNFYLVNDANLQTLQLALLDILKQSDAIAKAMQTSQDYAMIKERAGSISSMSIRMAITMVAVVPIFLVYPLMQRFFVKGIMLGAVKG